MLNYDIITTIDTGRLEILSYGSDEVIKYGQIVSILVRNKPYLGICITKNDAKKDEQSGGVSLDGKSFDIKPIEEILPIILPTQSLDLIFKTHAFSWNKISSIVSAVLQPFSYLTKQIPIIAKTYESGLIDMNVVATSASPLTRPLISTPQFNIHNEHNITLRIMYLIRNSILKLQSGKILKQVQDDTGSVAEISDLNEPSGQILILFPDIATLSSFESEISDIINNLTSEFKIKIDLDKYTSENSIISNRKTITNIIASKNLQIILSTRSGIFLPFKTLIQTLLIDESSNNYIQEQNSLYFDSRDISYILSQIWGCELDWASHLPSSRSLAFNKESNVAASLSRHNDEDTTSTNIQIFEKNSLFDDSHLYSAATEELIERDNGPILLIHPRRGNFRITQCQTCRYIWQCPDCSASLITYKNNFKRLELLCHHCQSKFDYPLLCPECKGSEVSSYSSGIDDLYENLTLTYPAKKIFKIDTSTSKLFQSFLSDLELYKPESPIFLTTKVFDPRIPYIAFKSIVFIQAQNLAVGVDYLTTEEIILSVFNLYIETIDFGGKILRYAQDDTARMQDDTALAQKDVDHVAAIKDRHENNSISSPQSPISIIFDTTNPDLEVLQKFIQLNVISVDKTNPYEDLLALYSDNISRELVIRQKFHLPPYYNLLLLSLNGKNLDKLKENVFTLYKWLKGATKDLQPELELTAPYTAKLLKRKGYYTYHLLLKYPKNFKHIKELDKILKPVIADMHIQARLNPRHIF